MNSEFDICALADVGNSGFWWKIGMNLLMSVLTSPMRVLHSGLNVLFLSMIVPRYVSA